MIDALLCEFEGVIADTVPLRRLALRRALAEEGAPPPADVELDRCARLGTEAAARAALHAAGAPPDDVGARLIAMRAERHFAALTAHGIVLVPGARELIARLAGTVRLALVTRAARREVSSALSLAELDAAFECIVCADDVPAPSPTADAWRLALRRLGSRRALHRDAAVALADAPATARAAREAGLRAITLHPDADLERVAAGAVVASLDAITPGKLESLLASPPKEAVG